MITEQLIVGVLFFMPLFVLLPTTFVWHLASLLLLAAVPLTLRLAISFLAEGSLLHLPLLLAWRAIWPHSFASGALSISLSM